MITTLIDKQDTFELVRDQIAGILAAEVTSQMAKATAAGEDSSLWDLAIYTERTNPWDRFDEYIEPIVNIWFDNDNIPETGSTVIRQKAVGIFNLDCYGYAPASNDANGGHNPGDKASVFVAHRAARLVRNIIMDPGYTYLSMQGTVWGRWITGRTAFQPQFDARLDKHVVGVRLPLQVTYNEVPPDYEIPGHINYVAIDIKRYEDGQVYLGADYDYS